MTADELLSRDCGIPERCASGHCMTCLRCIGLRIENLISLFGDDWLGAYACLCGHRSACGLTCARGRNDSAVETERLR
jgi:hypothetical protein